MGYSNSGCDGAGEIPPHGGDILTFEERYGRVPVDFSANTNPLGLSPMAREAVERSLDVADRYPDPRCRELVAAISEHEGVDGSTVVCGNGASDLLWRIAALTAPARAMVLAPTFSEYEEALIASGCEVVHHVLREEDGFVPGGDLVDRVREELGQGLGALFLCEPNNPTGATSPREVLEDVIGLCGDAGTTVVVDECFNGFLDDPSAATVVPLLRSCPTLIVVKAHTKIYGMAGLRLGYVLCGDAAAAEAICSAGPPWSVSSVAQAAGVAAFEDVAHVERCCRIVAAERPRIAEALRDAGCKVFESRANYLLAKAPDSSLAEALAREGVLVRSCSNYRGLSDRFVRVAVRSPEDNDVLIAALRRVRKTG